MYQHTERQNSIKGINQSDPHPGTRSKKHSQKQLIFKSSIICGILECYTEKVYFRVVRFLHIKIEKTLKKYLVLFWFEYEAIF